MDKQYSNLGWHRPDSIYDLVCYATANSKGWILEKIAREIMQATARHSKLVYLERVDVMHFPAIRADRNFFLNFDIAIWCLKKYPELHRSLNYIFFTHPDPIRTSDPATIRNTFNSVAQVFTMNVQDAERLEAMGVDPNRISTVIGGYDPSLFRPRSAKRGTRVGVVGAYYKRKNPDKFLEFARAKPDQKVLVVAPDPNSLVNSGLNWRNWDRFGEFTALDNVEFVEARHEQYPDIYKQFQVFLSLAEMEGGPIPLLECLGSGIPAVTTRTGFAPNVISPGSNGFLIDYDASFDEIANLISRCAQMDPDACTASVANASWSKFANSISEKFDFKFNGGEVVRIAKDSHGQFLFEQGWHLIEPGGIWSRDPVSSMRIPLARRKAGSYELTFKAWAFDRPDGLPHHVTVRLNGVNVIDSFSLDAQPRDLTIRVDAKNPSSGGEVIEFHCDNMLCSSMINPNSKKALGIRLRQLSVEYFKRPTQPSSSH